MSAGFTPGRWHPSQMRMDKDSWAALAGDHDLTIVQANWDGWQGDVIAAVWADDDHDELANARLIAAGPTMAAYIQRKADEGDEEAARIMETIHARS